MALVSVPVDITPPPADDSLVEPLERRVRFEPKTAAELNVSPETAARQATLYLSLTPGRIAA
ncbi:hypothetical protein SEA_CARON_68 [Microbacterium phage Caron]|uniref:Uncharacterized protein n=1 Tax=Microbacterium phage Caron TaxID=3028494 RepID=A0AAE9ZMK3_9CAUD|nr:hypothetical protein SEA_CARON_68 [Microbacterium phage Caron]